MSDHAKRLEAARIAVAEACIVCRRVQQSLSALRSSLKDDRSPVTVADYASQAIVARVLEQRLGQVTLVGEENAAGLREQLASGHREWIDAVLDALAPVWPDAIAEEVLHAIDLGGADPQRDGLHGFWTIDPIDGTKGFIRGQQYCISLAWIEGPSPVIGVLGCPNLSRDLSVPPDEMDSRGSLYLAEAGRGLFEYPADDPGASPVQIRRLEMAENEPIRLCESVESAHTSHDDSERVIERLGEADEPVRLDSQAKYAVVARGQADLYLRLPRSSKYVERIWDHAAGALIAAEAGCAVTDVDGRSLDFSHGRGLERNRGIVVAAPRLHGRVMGAIAELGIGDQSR